MAEELSNAAIAQLYFLLSCGKRFEITGLGTIQKESNIAPKPYAAYDVDGDTVGVAYPSPLHAYQDLLNWNRQDKCLKK